MPTLRQLRCLVALADLLNFGRAAERLNVTQPTLSAQLRELETRHCSSATGPASCRQTGAELARDCEGTTLDTLRQMVASGMGIALLPALYVRFEVLQKKLIVARPLSREAPVRSIILAWRRTPPQADRFTALARVMRDAVDRLPNQRVVSTPTMHAGVCAGTAERNDVQANPVDFTDSVRRRRLVITARCAPRQTLAIVSPGTLGNTCKSS